jgi:HD superfamily phosphohydrolase
MPSNKQRISRNTHVIYDVLYGFIPITEWEQKIINSPFFQRLRWIKQLGFANYIFPGAEHNRFAHVIGVMHSMDQMLRALGLAVGDNELFDPKSRSREAMLHKSLRIAALLHDLGTFPFSHAIEFAYMRHGNDHRRPRTGKISKGLKNLPNSHEHLGSFIIKNTDYDGGITRILQDYGIDVGLISKIIKGDSPHLVANQLMHSDLDADRMDYLIRDSHYTGLKYGQFDREYIMANLVTYEAGGGQVGFGVHESAQHAVEDFLIARFSWYSQVIKAPGSAKFDIMASHLAEAFLEKDLIYQFQDLLSMVESGDERFFWWNDMYFINRCQEARFARMIDDPRIAQWIEMILYRIPPRTVRHPLFAPKILKTNENHKQRLSSQILELLGQMQKVIRKHGTGKEWILGDLPHKDVVFTKTLPPTGAGRKRSSEQLLKERDPVRVITKEGKPTFLVERENTLMKQLSGYSNFMPSVYANEPAIALLKSRRMLPA